MRTKYTNDAAEKLAVAADRLEELAALVRTVDRVAALEMVKEAARLRRGARHVHTQASRVKRAQEDRKIKQAWKELDQLNQLNGF